MQQQLFFGDTFDCGGQQEVPVDLFLDVTLWFVSGFWVTSPKQDTQVHKRNYEV